MKKKLAIVSSYFSEEAYGLLGPQLAATVIQDHTEFDCIVVGVTNENDPNALRWALQEYFGQQTPVIGFSLLSGRENLFLLAKELRRSGALTILGGPQSRSDYKGEVDRQRFPHRFKGLMDHFTCALAGPVEQIVPWLQKDEISNLDQNTTGLLFRQDGAIIENPSKAWNGKYLSRVRWDNLYRLKSGSFIPHSVQTAQVLQQIGCPHASRMRQVEIDFPAALSNRRGEKISIPAKGCTFCDVASDKGFCGSLDDETVIEQIRCLPEDTRSRKIPFELINENPLAGLPRLLRRLKAENVKISQINLIMRADWFLAGLKHLTAALCLAGEMDVRILMASMGFEAFDDTLLSNFNKGITVKTNLEAIRQMRRLKELFPDTWLYSNREGAIHGFIHPTPWDSRKTAANTQKIFALYGLLNDILPAHSTPLIIHHAAALGDWIRAVEVQENIQCKRYGSIIGWWDL
jgi:hypothetical protein